MPLGDAAASSRAQPPCCSPTREIHAIVDYVGSVWPGPGVPTRRPRRRRPRRGPRAVHRALRRLPPGRRRGRHRDRRARARRSTDATPTQIAEAVRIGPVPDAEVLARARSRRASWTRSSPTSSRSQHPRDRGGWGIGHLGPFPEGMVDLARGHRRAARRRARLIGRAGAAMRRLRAWLLAALLVLARQAARAAAGRASGSCRPGDADRAAELAVVVAAARRDAVRAVLRRRLRGRRLGTTQLLRRRARRRARAARGGAHRRRPSASSSPRSSRRTTRAAEHPEEQRRGRADRARERRAGSRASGCSAAPPRRRAPRSGWPARHARRCRSARCSTPTRC